MSREIISVNNNRVVFGDAVSRVAESLSPLGVAARIVAELSACTGEMGRLRVESKRIAAGNSEQLAAIDARRAAVGATFDALRDSHELNSLNARQLLAGVRDAQRDLANAGTADERRQQQDVLRFLGELLVQVNSQGRVQLSVDIDKTLNGPAAPTWQPRNTPPVTTSSGRGGKNGQAGRSRSGRRKKHGGESSRD